MADVADRYRRLASDFEQTVAAVPDGAWTRPTPCAGWSARELLQHVIDAQAMLRNMVQRPTEPGPPLADDPVGAFRRAAEQVQADLDDPARAEEEFDGGFGRTTFARAIERFACFDLVVHRWDLGQATGVAVRLDPADVRWVRAAAEEFGPMLRSEGVCGPAVEPPPGAEEQDQLMAFLGRRPVSGAPPS